MKKIFLLITCVLGAVAFSEAQTIYFTQDFNSSTNVNTYTGAPITQNKFDGITTVGTGASFAIVNGKLQIVKVNGTGNIRASLTRTTAFVGAPATGPGFVRVSMEVAISGNTADVASGHRFMFGDNFPTTPAAPGNANIHCSLFINPTGKPGEFRVEGTNPPAVPNTVIPTFTGTKTIVWYVNNSGSDKGYTGPNGQINTVQNDYADAWVVDGATATLVVDEDPALTPTVNIRNFKLSNNPNFDATLDLDNLVIREEPSVAVKRITSIAAIPALSVPVKTEFTLIPFPTRVLVTYEDNTSELATIRFTSDATAVYNQFQVGTYNVIGLVTPVNGTINPNGLTAPTKVTVRGEVILTNTFSPNGDGKNDTWIIEELKRYSNTEVEVFDRDGKRIFNSTDANIGWDGKNLNGEVIAGSYFYVIKVPNLSLVKRGVVTVIK